MNIIKLKKGKKLLQLLMEGKNIALVTDAGTPGISDPGEELVKMCADAGVTVTAIPGPAACVTALILSGLPTRRFAFEAFLPSDKKERKSVLEALKRETRTIVLYEAPHRLLKTLKELEDVLGDRLISVCRELTKKHETIFRTTLKEALQYYEANEPRGECVLVIEGKSIQKLQEETRRKWEEMSIPEHMEYLYRTRGREEGSHEKGGKRQGNFQRDVYQALLS